MITSPWRIAGLLFAIGGLLSAVGAIIFASDPSGIGSIATLIGLLLEGAGFILFSNGLRSAKVRTWVRWLFAIAGGLLIFFGLSTLVRVPLGAATLLILLLVTGLILLGSLMLVGPRVTGRPLTWALIVLAILLLVNVFTGSPATLVLVGAVYIGIGILLLRKPRGAV
jgi:FtsH-binding integral membrane protein